MVDGVIQAIKLYARKELEVASAQCRGSLAYNHHVAKE